MSPISSRNRVPPDDAVALATSVHALLAAPERARALGQAANQRLRTRFSLAGFADAMFAAFDDAARDG
jgi:hypothetical protein